MLYIQLWTHKIQLPIRERAYNRGGAIADSDRSMPSNWDLIEVGYESNNRIAMQHYIAWDGVGGAVNRCWCQKALIKF